jgi:peroxin-3
MVLENCLDKAVEVLFDGLEKNVFVEDTTTVQGGDEKGKGVEGRGGEGDVRIRLASLLPGLSRWSELAVRSVPCELVDVRPHSFFSIPSSSYRFFFVS